jgi:spore maturation protein CgeB
MDTPVTLSRLDRGESVSYLPKDGLQGFDLVLSYTGGLALDQLRERLQAKRTAALYGWVDPTTHFPVPPDPKFTSDFSYLGTFAADRHKALQELLLTPAARLPQHRFLIGGAMYPDAGTWPGNVRFLDHVAPPEHCPFYCSSPVTLNVTRQSMAAMGYCPSGRLFEAAACGTAVLSDWWEGLDTFFKPNEEILVARSSDDAVRAITGDHGNIRQIGRRAMERALDCHTAEARGRRLVSLLEDLPDESAFEVTSAVLASRNG